MKCVINNQIVLSHGLEGPIAPHIGLFAKSLSEQGYALRSIHFQVSLAACFSQWLKRHGVVLDAITSDHPSRYLRYRARQVRLYPGDAASLNYLLDFLRRQNVLSVEKISPRRLTSAERNTQAYEQHLRDARGLARATIINYVPFVRSFLQDRFRDGPVIPCQAPEAALRRTAHRHGSRPSLRRSGAPASASGRRWPDRERFENFARSAPLHRQREEPR